jgi:hypothetical protein
MDVMRQQTASSTHNNDKKVNSSTLKVSLPPNMSYLVDNGTNLDEDEINNGTVKPFGDWTEQEILTNDDFKTNTKSNKKNLHSILLSHGENNNNNNNNGSGHRSFGNISALREKSGSKDYGPFHLKIEEKKCTVTDDDDRYSDDFVTYFDDPFVCDTSIEGKTDDAKINIHHEVKSLDDMNDSFSELFS